MTTQPPPLRVPAWAYGPAGSGNGGWVCGAMAERADPAAGAVRVRLSVPPPLEVDLHLVPFTFPDGAAGLRLAGGPTTVAEAMVVADAPPPVPPAPGTGGDPDAAFAAALRAGERFAGDHGHPAPGCLGCGTARTGGAADPGLRLRPGTDGTDGTGASTSTAWVPHQALDAGDGSVGTAMVWTALDCPGGWTAAAAGSAVHDLVLGTMTAQVLRRPRVGERCVVRGEAERPTAGAGRTVPARTTLYGDRGEVLATSEQVWVRLA